MNQLYKSLLKKIADTGDTGLENAKVSSEEKYYIYDLNNITDKIESEEKLKVLDDVILYKNIINDVDNISELSGSETLLNHNLDLSKEEIKEVFELYPGLKSAHLSDTGYISAGEFKELRGACILTNPLDDNAKVSKSDKERISNNISKIASSTTSDILVSNLISDIYSREYSLYIPENFEEEENRSEAISSDSIEDKHVFAKMILDKILKNIPTIEMDVEYEDESEPSWLSSFFEEDTDPDLSEESREYLTEQFFEKEQYDPDLSKEIYSEAFGRAKKICYEFINNHKKSSFWFAEKSKIDISQDTENPFNSAILFLDESYDSSKGRKKINDFTQKPESIIVDFDSENLCYISFSKGGVSGKIEYNLETKSMSFASGEDRHKKDFIVKPIMFKIKYNKDSIDSYLNSKLDYAVFKYLSEDSYDNSILITSFRRSGIPGRQFISNETGDTAGSYLNSLIQKIFSYSSAYGSEVSLEEALYRSSAPIPKFEQNKEYDKSSSIEIEKQDKSSVFVNKSEERALEEEIRSLESKENRTEEDNISLSSKKNKLQQLKANIDVMSIDQAANEISLSEKASENLTSSQISYKKRNVIFERSFQEDFSKIYNLKLRIPSMLAKILVNANYNLNDPEYGYSRSNTRFDKGHMSILDFGDPIQNQVVASYTRDFVQRSWPEISSALDSSFEEIGVDLSNQDKAELLDAYQSQALDSLRQFGTSRSISSLQDIGEVINIFTTSEVTNDFNSFKMDYVPDEPENVDANEANDFELHTSAYLRNISRKNIIKKHDLIRKAALNEIFKFATGAESLLSPEVDVASDSAARTRAFNSAMFYQEVITRTEGNFFLPIQIKTKGTVKITEVKAFNANGRQPKTLYSDTRKGLNIQEKFSGQGALFDLDATLYASKSKIVMADEGLKVSSMQGTNILTADGLLEAIGVEDFDKLLTDNSPSRTPKTQIQVKLSIDSFGETNEVILALKKEGDEIILVNSAQKSLKEVFKKALPNIGGNILELYSGQENGKIHMTYKPGESFLSRSEYGVSHDEFKRWALSDPESPFFPLEVHFDQNGQRLGLRSGSQMQISSVQNEFAASYDVVSGSFEDISDQPDYLKNPSKPSFYEESNFENLKDISMNRDLKMEEKAFPSIISGLSSTDNTTKYNSIIAYSFLDPISRISYETSSLDLEGDQLRNKIAQSISENYDFLNQTDDLYSKRKVSALTDVIEFLKYINESGVISGIPLGGEITDAVQRRFFESSQVFTGRIIESALKDRSRILAKESIEKNDKIILAAIDNCLLQIKDLSMVNTNRLSTSISRQLSVDAPWLSKNSALSFYSENSISINRSSLNEESLNRSFSSIKRESVDLSYQLSKDYESIVDSLKKSGDKTSDLKELSKLLHRFSRVTKTRLSSLDFNDRLNFFRSVLSAASENNLPPGYNKNNDAKLLYDLINENDDLRQFFNSSEVESIKSIYNTESLKKSANIKINSEEKFREFIDSEEGKFLKEYLLESQEKLNEKLNKISNLIATNGDVGEYNKFVSEINAELRAIRELSNPSDSLYIKESVLENIVLGYFKEFSEAGENIPKFFDVVKNRGVYGRGVLLNSISQAFDNQQGFYYYILKDQESLEYIKSSLMEELQDLNNLKITSAPGKNLSYELNLSSNAEFSQARISFLNNLDESSISSKVIRKMYIDYSSTNSARSMKNLGFNAYYLMDKEELARLVTGLDDLSGLSWNFEYSMDPTNGSQALRLKAKNTSGQTISLGRSASDTLPGGGTVSGVKSVGPGYYVSYDLSRLEQGSYEQINAKILSEENNLFESPREIEDFLKSFFSDEAAFQNSEVKINFDEMNADGKQRVSFSVFYENEMAFKTKTKNIGAILSSTEELKLLKSALKRSGFSDAELADNNQIAKALEKQFSDANTINELRIRDVKNGTDTFRVIYDRSMSKTLTESLNSIDQIDFGNKGPAQYNSVISSYIDKETSRLTASVVSDDAKKLKEIYDDLSDIRKYYNSNKYLNPEVSNRIFNKIKSKFPESSNDDVAKLLYFLGFNTGAQFAPSAGTALLRANSTVGEVEKIKNLLEYIEKIRKQRSLFGDYEVFEKRISDIADENPLIYSISDPDNPIELDKYYPEGADPNATRVKKKSQSFVSFIAEEIEIIESRGNWQLAETMRNNLYEALDYNGQLGSRSFIQRSDSLMGRYITNRSSEVAWLLSKIGILQETDLEKAEKILADVKDLEKQIKNSQEDIDRLSAEFSQKLQNSSDDVDAELERLEKEIKEKMLEVKDMEQRVSKTNATNLDLNASRAALNKATRARKTLRFMKNMLLASANPLNSMEFTYLLYILGYSQNIYATAVVQLINAFRTGVFSDLTQRISLFMKDTGKIARLSDIIPSYKVDASASNELLNIVEDKTYKSYRQGALSDNYNRAAQNRSAAGKVKVNKKILPSSSRLLKTTFRAVVKVLGKYIAILLQVLYAKSLYDNITGDQLETGILYPSEIVHNLTLAFVKMKDHTFKESSNKTDSWDQDIFSDEDTLKLSKQGVSLYKVFLDSENIANMNECLEKLDVAKSKVNQIINKSLKEENINENLNLDLMSKLKGVYASHVEITTTLSQVLPKALSQAIAQYLPESLQWAVSSILECLFKILGTFLAALNLVDIPSLFANKLFVVGDKFKPNKQAFTGSKDIVNDVIDEIKETLMSLNVYVQTLRNSKSTMEDPYLKSFYGFYSDKLSTQN